jgi:hypothetical protein
MLTSGLLLIGALESASFRWEPLTLADAAARQAAVARPAEICVTLGSKGRLTYGTPFVAELPAGLELKLRPEADFGWSIAVGRPGGMVNYIWVVSPPFQTAPHLQLGPAYGLSARESMAFVRELRFVLTDEAYEAALKIVREEVASAKKMATLERLGSGRLTIDVVKYGIRPGATAVPLGEALDWIEFKGEACVPK